jgi:glyoxylase-like metal-dependent hydrolase (beta-lactamase superfamily II)
MEMYLLNKQLFSSVEVEATYDGLRMEVGPIHVLHVPGHCPGQVVFQVDDILLSGDHVLESTTPHQAPEQLSHYTGLGHYLDSLERLLPLAQRVRLTLGGHEKPIFDLPGRILDIRDMHMERLEQMLSALEEPKTILELAGEMFGEVDGYDELLAIEEAGAHVEYLQDRAHVRLANWDELKVDPQVPWQFVRACESVAPPVPRRGIFAPASESPMDLGENSQAGMDRGEMN